MKPTTSPEQILLRGPEGLTTEDRNALTVWKQEVSGSVRFAADLLLNPESAEVPEIDNYYLMKATEAAITAYRANPSKETWDDIAERMEELGKVEQIYANLTAIAAADLASMGVDETQAPDLAKGLVGTDAAQVSTIFYKKPKSPRILSAEVHADYGKEVMGSSGEDLTGGMMMRGMGRMDMHEIERPEGLEPNQKGFYFATNADGRLITQGGAAVRPVYGNIRIDLTNLAKASVKELQLLQEEVASITGTLIGSENRASDSVISGYDACEVTVVTDADTWEVLNSAGITKDEYKKDFAVLIGSSNICEVMGGNTQTVDDQTTQVVTVYNPNSFYNRRDGGSRFSSVSGRNPSRGLGAVVAQLGAKTQSPQVMRMAGALLWEGR